MGYRFFLSFRAEHDILDAIDWYNDQKQGLGDDFYKDFTSTLNYVIVNPYIFALKRNPFRECTLKKFPYIIIYRVYRDMVIIASVFNTSKNPGQKPKKY